MKTIFATFLLLSGLTLAPDLCGAAPAPPFLWAKPVDGGSVVPSVGLDGKGKPRVVERTGSLAYAVAVDHAGNAYLAGQFSGTAIFGDITLTSRFGGGDAFVAKLDGNGNYLWATQVKPAAEIGGSVARSVAVDDAGNIYLAGAFRNAAVFGATTLTPDQRHGTIEDIFVAKLDANGNFLWARQAGGPGQEYTKSVAVDRAGNSYVAGIFGSFSMDPTATFGPTMLKTRGRGTAFVAKLDAHGNFLWANQAGGTRHDAANSVAVDGAGNTFLAGHFTGPAAFDAITLTGNAHHEAFIAKLDVGGRFLWARQTTGSNTNIAHCVAVDRAGNACVTGLSYGTTAFGSTTVTNNSVSGGFVTKLDASGNFLWARAVGGNHEAYGRTVTMDEAGNIYLAGSFRRTATFGTTTLIGGEDQGIFVAKLDAHGNFLWAKQAGGGGRDGANSVKVDNRGNVYLAGVLNYVWKPSAGTAAFDTKSLPLAATHAYVAKIAAQPFGSGVVPTSNARLRVLVPQRLQSPQRGFSGQFQLLFSDDDGSAASDPTRFEVHYTTNFAGANTVWITNASSLRITNGVIIFDDLDSPGAARRFYRVIEK